MRRVFSYQRARRHKDRIPKGGSPGQSIVRIRQTRSKIKRKKKWQSCFLSPLRTRISNSTRRRYRGIVYIIICCQRRHMHMKVLLKTNIGKHGVCLTVKWLFVRKLYTCLTAYILCTFCWYEANEIWSGIDYFLSLCRSYHVYIYIYMYNVVFDSKTVQNKVRLLRCCRAGQISLPSNHRMSLSRQVRPPSLMVIAFSVLKYDWIVKKLIE